MTTDALFWDGIAATYAAKPVDDPEAFDRKTAITLSHLDPDARVLDVGCGTGSFALRLAPHVAEVHGLDVSGAMLQFARDKARGLDHVAFHQGTLAELPASVADLDMVCAYSLLHLVDDLPGTLRALYDRLKPGGVFVSSTVVLGDSWVPYRPLLTVMRWAGKAPRVEVLRHEVLLAAIRDAGFVDVDTPDVGADATIAFVVARRP
jgi:ubiquinone/menaquinone biosynthesis C-methylase UbiE